MLSAPRAAGPPVTPERPASLVNVDDKLSILAHILDRAEKPPPPPPPPRKRPARPSEGGPEEGPRRPRPPPAALRPARPGPSLRGVKFADAALPPAPPSAAAGPPLTASALLRAAVQQAKPASLAALAPTIEVSRERGPGGEEEEEEDDGVFTRFGRAANANKSSRSVGLPSRGSSKGGEPAPRRRSVDGISEMAALANVATAAVAFKALRRGSLAGDFNANVQEIRERMGEKWDKKRDQKALKAGEPELHRLHKGEYQYYTFEIPQGSNRFLINLQALSGDPDLFASFREQFPGTERHQFKSEREGDDVLEVTDEHPDFRPGPIYIAVYAESKSEYRLTIRSASSAVLTPSKIAMGKVEPSELAFYRIQISDARQSVSFKLTLRDPKGNPLTIPDDEKPKLHVSAKYKFPNSVTAVWSGVFEEEEEELTLTVDPIDLQFRTGWWYACVEPGPAACHFKICASQKKYPPDPRSDRASLQAVTKAVNSGLYDRAAAASSRSPGIRIIAETIPEDAAHAPAPGPAAAAAADVELQGPRGAPPPPGAPRPARPAEHSASPPLTPPPAQLATVEEGASSAPSASAPASEPAPHAPRPPASFRQPPHAPRPGEAGPSAPTQGPEPGAEAAAPAQTGGAGSPAGGAPPRAPSFRRRSVADVVEHDPAEGGGGGGGGGLGALVVPSSGSFRRRSLAVAVPARTRRRGGGAPLPAHPRRRLAAGGPLADAGRLPAAAHLAPPRPALPLHPRPRPLRPRPADPAPAASASASPLSSRRAPLGVPRSSTFSAAGAPGANRRSSIEEALGLHSPEGNPELDRDPYLARAVQAAAAELQAIAAASPRVVVPRQPSFRAPPSRVAAVLEKLEARSQQAAGGGTGGAGGTEGPANRGDA
eukprot:tig00021489_g21690.t1